MCYEQKNVMVFLEFGGVAHLVRYLGKIPDEELQVRGSIIELIISAGAAEKISFV